MSHMEYKLLHVEHNGIMNPDNVLTDHSKQGWSVVSVDLNGINSISGNIYAFIMLGRLVHDQEESDKSSSFSAMRMRN